jgi:hypothetical protein
VIKPSSFIISEGRPDVQFFPWEIVAGNFIYLVDNRNRERRRDPVSRFVPLQERGFFYVQIFIPP